MMDTSDDKVLNVIPSVDKIGINEVTIDTDYLCMKLRFRLSNMDNAVTAVFVKDEVYYENNIYSKDTDIYEITAKMDAQSISPIKMDVPLKFNSNEFADAVSASIMSNKEMRERILDAQLPEHKQLTYNTVVLISNVGNYSIIIPIETHEKEA